MSPKVDHSHDESFKVLAREHFGKYCRVITDFEFFANPKRADLLIIESDSPIYMNTRIFSYFKEVNVVEFKSEVDSFRVKKHFPQILFYIGGALSNEKRATIENMTFTLISSRKPVKFLKMFKKSTKKIENGVYFITDVLRIPVYVVVPNEVCYRKGGNEVDELDEELALLKQFSTGKERERFLREALQRYFQGEELYSSHLLYAFSLYRDEVIKIASEEGLNMTLIEKNMLAWVDDLNLREKILAEGRKEWMAEKAREDACKMVKKGLELGLIMELTGLSEEDIRQICK